MSPLIRPRLKQPIHGLIADMEDRGYGGWRRSIPYMEDMEDISDVAVMGAVLIHIYEPRAQSYP